LAEAQREVVIVGAGIAGASLACFLAEAGVKNVLLIEREARPAHHASGRSAEALVEVDEDPVWQRLVSEGARFMRQPPPGVARTPLCRPSGVINLIDAAERGPLEASLPGLRWRGVEVDVLEPRQVLALLPFITARGFAGAMSLPRSGRLLVAALMAGYLGSARARGVETWLSTDVTAVEHTAGRVSGVVTTRGQVRCRTLVCAAGAWAGELGRMAGATPIQFAALRRTVISFDAPAGVVAEGWPLVSFDSRGIYFAPEGKGLLASPMDEDPVTPCDAIPVSARVDQTLARLSEVAGSLRPTGLRGARAGLRTFAPDRRPVVGEDPLCPGFFWLAGQGGRGIETSPSLGRLAAQLIARGSIDETDLAAAMSPARFPPA
jgi:D-arginine dehydrogenase